MGMQLIETIVVGAGGAASIEFTGIPQDGVDLMLAVSARVDYAIVAYSLGIQLNGLTSGYSARNLKGTGSAAASQTSAVTSFVQVQQGINSGGSTANTFSNSQVYIPNYTSSVAKSLSFDSVVENNATEAYQELVAGLSTNTAAVTSLKVVSQGGLTLQQYSTASLYKIKYD